MKAHFEGRVITEWLEEAAMGDGRDRVMRLVEPFGFRDSRGFLWLAPAGALLDGASIPRFFWRIFDPFIGAYRRASVIHDWYCKSRALPSWMVHRMFYEACRVGHVSRFKAFVLWLAVRTFGPRFKGSHTIQRALRDGLLS